MPQSIPGHVCGSGHPHALPARRSGTRDPISVGERVIGGCPRQMFAEECSAA
jgi:hypothetical protein